jgi:hypothetical protein
MLDVMDRPSAVAAPRGPDPTAHRHAVSFDVYVDVCCPDDEGASIAKAFGLLHHAIVAGARVAAAFPDMSGAMTTGLGCRLRILGSADDVRQAVFYTKDDGLTLAKVGFVTPQSPVPKDTRGAVAYVRVRDVGVGVGELKRRDARAKRRLALSKCTMTPQDFKAREEHRRAQTNPTHGLPSLQLSSGSTGRAFLVHVGRREQPLSGRWFGSYGLSNHSDDGLRGSVPDFE